MSPLRLAIYNLSVETDSMFGRERMNKLVTVILALLTLASCSKKEPPAPPIQLPATSTPAPVQALPEKPRFTGTRVGPLLASIVVVADVLVSHNAEATDSPPQAPGSLTPWRAP